MIKLLVCVTCLFITIDVVKCTHVYTFNPELPGWVALHMAPATWDEAVLTCHFEGATLASPIDKNMSKILQEVIMSELEMNQRIFIGTQRLYFSNEFVSVEDYEISIQFSNTDKQEACLTMGVYGDAENLYTSSCTEPHPYVCYKKYNYETANQCGTFDDNYRLNEDTGSCYKLHREHHKWSRANMICAAEGGYLVILNNAEEAKFVTEMFLNDTTIVVDPWQPMHVGLRAWTSDRIWLTVHGESLENVYNSWAQEQLDNYMINKDCGVLTRSGVLDGIFCDSRAIFVCEKDPSGLMFQTVEK